MKIAMCISMFQTLDPLKLTGMETKDKLKIIHTIHSLQAINDCFDRDKLKLYNSLMTDEMKQQANRKEHNPSLDAAESEFNQGVVSLLNEERKVPIERISTSAFEKIVDANPDLAAGTFVFIENNIVEKK